MKVLCSLSLGSVHQKTDLLSLKTFSWMKAKEELISHAPIYLSIISSCLPSAGDKTRHDVILGFVSAILLKARNRSMCAVQTQLSLILYQGHTSKMV